MQQGKSPCSKTNGGYALGFLPLAMETCSCSHKRLKHIVIEIFNYQDPERNWKGYDENDTAKKKVIFFILLTFT